MGELMIVITTAVNQFWDGLLGMSSGRIVGPLLAVAVLALIVMPVVGLLLRFIYHD